MKFICLRLGIIPSIFKNSKEYYNNRKTYINNRLITASHDVYTFQNLSFFGDSFNLLKENEFKQFRTKIDRKHGWIDKNYIYIPIKKIEKSNYNGKVYNLEVEENNSYVTPSATVHNCMTPWFGLFGSKSGFDSLKECFQDQTHKIYAIESGMSADPEMLWRLNENVNIVSFSDAHSFWPWRLGRESTIFELKELSYKNIIKAIREGEGLQSTIETPPEYGKYHWDGHRNCNFSCSPDKTKELNGICPICKKPLIIGVDYRIEELAKHPKGFKSIKAKPFLKLLPLHELIALHINKKLENKQTLSMYDSLIEEFKNEFSILLDSSKEALIRKNVDTKLIELIIRNREGKIKVKPGFDGEYGQAILGEKQATLV